MNLNRDIEYRRICRKQRVLKLISLAGAFSAFHKMELNREILLQKSTYEDAERLSDFINKFFSKDTKPTDFINSEAELENKILDSYKNFVKWLNAYEGSYQRSGKELEAFCKEVYYGKTCYRFLVDFLNFLSQMTLLMAYLCGEICKTEFEKKMVNIGMFGTSPVSPRLLRYNILAIEKVFSEVQHKQENRRNKKLILLQT